MTSKSAGRRARMHLLFTVLGCTLPLLFVIPVLAQPVSVSVNTRQPGTVLSEETLGLSYETSLLLPDKNGVRYFRPDNQPLKTIFRTVGVKCLRIGGSSVDAPEIPIPTREDVESLFEFAKAAGVKVIYSVRLNQGDPGSAAMFAKLIHDHYPETIESFAIGNEPEYYPDYTVFRSRWLAIRDAMAAAAPGARFSGPDDDYQRAKKLARDFGPAPAKLAQVTMHKYPFGCAYKNPQDKADSAKLVPFDAPASREKMLSGKADAGYEEDRAGMADAITGTALTFRLSEVNSYWCSGLRGVSDSYASALWGADYLHWWASHGAAGLNFHTGDRTGGAENFPCRDAAFVSSAHGYEARPLAYGMKLFDLGGHGQALPVSVSAAPVSELVAYATLDGEKTVCVTLLNKSHGAGVANTGVQINLDAPLVDHETKTIFLTSVGGDIAAEAGDVHLGGARIEEDGTWKGQWDTVEADDQGEIHLSMPPASAVVLKATLR